MRRIPALILLFLVLGGAGDKRSGYHDASPETRAMQDDDAANPGMLWVLRGEALWPLPAGRSGRSCASCHALESMDGVAARYPRVDPIAGRVITLDAQIRQCRTQRQGTVDGGPDNETVLSFGAFLGHRSRASVMAVDGEGAAHPFLDAGRRVFETRLGQLNLSCAQCHDGLAGHRLAGSVIPQGHANAYPLYRLEWQEVGSLQRRIRNCTNGVRAEPFETDDPDLLNLMLFLGWRSNGLPVETPAVRP